MSAAALANGAQIALAQIPLFAGIADGAAERVERFMARFEIASGERLFGQGDLSGRMHVIEHGRLELQVELGAGQTRALAELGPGELLGETSLLGGGRRTATAVAREPTSGWVLDRAGFEMLRLDVSAGAVEFMARMAELAVARLRARYQMIAAGLGGDGGALAGPPARQAAVPAAAELAAPEYLRGLLCFREFRDHEQIAAAISGATLAEVPRGAVVVAADEVPAALLVVVRGAVDVSVRRGGTAQRVRLAGPGRFVGHVGVLDRGPSPVVARTRERAVLIRLPGERAREMLREPSVAARRFSAALAEDMARALQQAERPVARTSSAANTQSAAGRAASGAITGLRRTQSWLHGRSCRMRNDDRPGWTRTELGELGPSRRADRPSLSAPIRQGDLISYQNDGKFSTAIAAGSRERE